MGNCDPSTAHTGMTSESSSPIAFESIKPKFEQDRIFGHDNDNVVSITLSAPIDFVMALESREQPPSQKDSGIRILWIRVWDKATWREPSGWVTPGLRFTGRQLAS